MMMWQRKLRLAGMALAVMMLVVATCSVMGITEPCTSPADCDDNDACTDDSCNIGTGECINEAISCEDNNACTSDSCDPATGCVNTDNTDSCDDGDACTTDDTCSGGSCQGTAVSDDTPCASGDGVCCNGDCVECCTEVQCSGSMPFCDSSSHTCVCNDDANCDDGNECTDDDCSGGTCSNTPNAISCDDGDPSTDNDQCDENGDCRGTQVDDDDGDGVPESTDNCPTISNSDQADADGNGIGDACDADNDGDGVPDSTDNCPTVSNPGQTDADGNGVGDACDTDTDGDGVPDSTDNCPTVSNPDQADADGNGIGNACDTDNDGDGVPDSVDNCPTVSNTDQVDTDNDGIGNACGVDNDGDGISDSIDNCPTVSNPDQADADGNGIGDACGADNDDDGVPDSMDNCPTVSNPDQADADGDGTGDACGADNDGDGVPDGMDNCPTVSNPDQADADGDGIGDACVCLDGSIMGTDEGCASCGDICTGEKTCCSGECIEPGTNANCAYCGDACTGGTSCIDGACVCSDGSSLGTDADCASCGDLCTDGKTCCSGACTELGTDANCAYCGDACTGGTSCIDGACVCSDGNGLGTDANCVSCGDVCPDGKACCSGACIELGADADSASCGEASTSGSQLAAVSLNYGFQCFWDWQCPADTSCTNYYCSFWTHRCIPSPKVGQKCNDNNNDCDGISTCDSSGICTPTTPPVVCTAQDQCHEPGTCYPWTGQCSNPQKPFGSPCHDSNECTLTDSCRYGMCIGSNPKICTAPDKCYRAGTCNPSTGFCSEPSEINCNDRLYCDGEETCNPSIGCVRGTPPACRDSFGCTWDFCDEFNDKCQNFPLDFVCNNWKYCDGRETCDPDEGCVDGTPPCNDGNDCTTETCYEHTDSCSSTPLVDGTDCEFAVGDTLRIMSTGKCCGGVCKECCDDPDCDDGDVCTDDSCDPATGCVHENNAASCSDGNACTQTDNCQAGACVGSNPVTCAALDQCHDVGDCDTGTGLCSNPPKTNGAVCTDGNACTTGDTCSAGACQPGAPLICNDNNICTSDACNPATGCVYPNNNNPCPEDGIECTDDVCSGGSCTHPNSAHGTLCHDDGEECTDDICDSGECIHPPTKDGEACTDDGNECTENVCLAGSCTAKPVADETTCSGGVCQGGACVAKQSLPATTGCKSASDCPYDPCKTYSCVNSVCQSADKCSPDETCEDGVCIPDSTSLDHPLPPATPLSLPTGTKVITLTQMNVNQQTILPGCSTAIKFVVVPPSQNCALFCTNGFCCGGMCCPAGLLCLEEKCTIPKLTKLISPDGEDWVCGEDMIVEVGTINGGQEVTYIIHFKGQELTTLAEETAGKKRKTRDEIAGLNWEGSTLNLILYAPNGTMIPADINDSMIEHKKGPTYDYYILKNAPPGNWTLKVVPIDVPAKGENYTLLTGGISREMDLLKVMAEETAGKKRKTRDEIAGLNWEGSTLDLILLDPNNNMVPTTGFNRTYVEHMKGPTYDYYLLKNATPGNWTMQITAIDVDEGGEPFNIVNGPVQELETIDMGTFGRK